MPTLDPGLDLAAYRIVQVALTNALKHSRAPTTVAVLERAGTFASRSATVARPRTGAGPAAHDCGGGHGLVGMAERQCLTGGSFCAEALPDGGYVVRAHIPIGSRG